MTLSHADLSNYDSLLISASKYNCLYRCICNFICTTSTFAQKCRHVHSHTKSWLLQDNGAMTKQALFSWEIRGTVRSSRCSLSHCCQKCPYMTVNYVSCGHSLSSLLWKPAHQMTVTRLEDDVTVESRWEKAQVMQLQTSFFLFFYKPPTESPQSSRQSLIIC